jgi:GWxTD domain-containing protein
MRLLFRCSFFVLAMSWVPSALLAQQPITLERLKNAYHPGAELFLRQTYFLYNDSLHVYLQLKLNDPKASPQQYTFRFESVTDPDQGKRIAPLDTSAYTRTYLGAEENQHYYHFKLPHRPGTKVLFATISSQVSGLDYFLPLSLDRIINPGLVVVDAQTGLPVLDPYINRGREIYLRTYPPSSQMTGFVYKASFPAALPPMVTDPPKTDSGMRVDSVFSLSPVEPFTLITGGLYLLQTDTTKAQGLAFRVQGPHYPNLVELKDLIPPLIYITNREERAGLDKSYNDKKSFDKFWLDMSGSPERARKIIRNYYQRVEEANTLFTSFKEGWQTDRGMIYTLYGPPDDVVGDGTGEEWLYTETNDLPRMRFRFVHSPNIFAPNNYVLVRSKRLDTNWFRVVDLWRKARMGK